MSQNKCSIDIPALEKRLTTALKSDVDELAKSFCELETTQFEAFAKLFNEKETSTIFLGRLSIADLVEEQIFGIYLAYCLYFLQPQQYVMPIRVSVVQMESLHTFTKNVLMPEEHFEPLFCLFRLISSNAFTVTPFETEFNPLLHRRFDTSEIEATSAEENDVESTEDFLLLSELHEDTMLKRINNIHQAYLNLKDKCGLAEPENGLNLVTGNLCSYIQNLMGDTKKNFEEQKKKNLEASTSKEDTAKSRRSKIRHDAYSTPYQQQRHRRHRQGPDSKLETQEATPKVHFQSPTKSPKAKKAAQKRSPTKKHLSSIEAEVMKDFEARERKACERRQSESANLNATTDAPSSSTATQVAGQAEGADVGVRRTIKSDPASEMDEDEELIKQRFLRIKAQLE